MKLTSHYRCGLSVLALASAGFLLSGCFGDPTYGTGTTQGAQLADDLGNLVSLPKNKASDINYRPRPGLVQPPAADADTLPPPEKSVASSKDPNWPQSPEDIRERQVAEINAENGDGKYLPHDSSPRMISGGRPVGASTDARTRQFRNALVVEQGTYTGRKFLSDPPSQLRDPASTAPTNDLGKPEKQKERERLRAAKKLKSGKSWWPF